MGNFLEKIALGDIGLSGKFDIVVTNDRTGRVYQELHEKNYFNPIMYDVLRSLLIRNLSFVNNAAISTALLSPEFHVTTSSFGSNIMQQNSLFRTVYLTTGTAPESTINPHTGFDGIVRAIGSDAIAVTSGGRQGTATVTEWYQTRNQIYKRWDWTSSNGNGIFTKIFTLPEPSQYMCAVNRLNEKDIFVRSFSYNRGALSWILGGDYDLHGLWGRRDTMTTRSATLLPLRRQVVAPHLPALWSDQDFDITSPSSGLNFEPTASDAYFILESKINSDIIYLITVPHSSSGAITIHRISLSMRQVLSRGVFNIGPRLNSANILCVIDTSDMITLYGGVGSSTVQQPWGIYRSVFNPLNMTAGEVTPLTTSMTGVLSFHNASNRSRYLGRLGDVMFFTEAIIDQRALHIYSLNIQTGRHSVSVANAQLENTINASLDGYSKEILILNNATCFGYMRHQNKLYSVYGSTANHPYLYLRYCDEDFLPNHIFTTSKLFAHTPIEKTINHSMFVGYTLEIE